MSGWLGSKSTNVHVTPPRKGCAGRTSQIFRLFKVNALAGTSRTIAGVGQLDRLEAILDRDGGGPPVDDRVDEGAAFLAVAPLVFLRQLVRRLGLVAAIQCAAGGEAFHFAGHERRVMAEDFDALV